MKFEIVWYINKWRRHVKYLYDIFEGRGRAVRGSIFRRHSGRGSSTRRHIHELTEAPTVHGLTDLSTDQQLQQIIREPSAMRAARTRRRPAWQQQIHSVAEAGRPVDVVDFTMPGFALIDDRFVDRTSYSRDTSASTEGFVPLTTLPKVLRPTTPLIPDVPIIPTEIMRLAYSRSMVHVRRWPMYHFDDLLRGINNLPTQFQPSIIVCHKYL